MAKWVAVTDVTGNGSVPTVVNMDLVQSVRKKDAASRTVLTFIDGKREMHVSEDVPYLLQESGGGIISQSPAI